MVHPTDPPILAHAWISCVSQPIICCLTYVASMILQPCMHSFDVVDQITSKDEYFGTLSAHQILHFFMDRLHMPIKARSKWERFGTN